MPRRSTGNLVFEIPGADPVLNERLRRIAEQIELSRISQSTATPVVGTVTGPIGDGLPEVTGALQIVDGVIGVKQGGITTELIKTFAISAAKLAAGAVETDKIKAGAVDATKIKNASITNVLIANAAISAANIQDAAITTAKIQNGAITNLLVANAAITEAKIGDLAVSNAKIASIAANKISAGTVTAVNMVAGTLTLNTNGITTTITNATDAAIAQPVGVRVSDNTSGYAGKFNANNVVFSHTALGFTGTAAFLGGGAPGRGALQLNDITNNRRYINCQVGGYLAPFLPSLTFVEVANTDGLSALFTARLSASATAPALIFNSLQVVGPRGASVADATDAASVITQLNALLARCRAHGLIS